MESIQADAVSQGVDTLKVAVMEGNSRARHLYEEAGFEAGEQVLYAKSESVRSVTSDASLRRCCFNPVGDDA